MTLYAACQIGLAKGLNTVDEVVTDIEINANNLFPSSNNIAQELHELHCDLLQTEKDAQIKTIFPYLYAEFRNK